MLRFAKTDRKIEKMQPYLAAQAKTGRSGLAAIGVAQEFAPVFIGTQRPDATGTPWCTFGKAACPLRAVFTDFAPAAAGTRYGNTAHSAGSGAVWPTLC